MVINVNKSGAEVTESTANQTGFIGSSSVVQLAGEGSMLRREWCW